MDSPDSAAIEAIPYKSAIMIAPMCWRVRVEQLHKSPSNLRVRKMLETPKQHQTPLIADRKILTSGRKPNATHPSQRGRARWEIGKGSTGRKVILYCFRHNHHFQSIIARTSLNISRLAELAVAKSSVDGWNAMDEMGLVRCSSDRSGAGLRNGLGRLTEPREVDEYKLTIPVLDLENKRKL